MHPLLREVNAGGEKDGRYANFVGEFAVIEHRPVHRVFRAGGGVAGGPRRVDADSDSPARDRQRG